MVTEPMTWTPAKVGCYWSCGPFTIGTYVTGGVYTFPESGYELIRNFKVLGRYATLKEAQEAARKEVEG